MVKELFTVCLLVNNFERSLSFYKDVLELEVNNVNSKFADFKVNGTSLAIFEKDEATLMFPKRFMNAGGGTVLAFQVDNISEYCQDLAKKGVKVFEGPKETPWGQKVAYFLDPDKNVWEVSEK